VRREERRGEERRGDERRRDETRRDEMRPTEMEVIHALAASSESRSSKPVATPTSAMSISVALAVMSV
jgi:hypothetical protein